MKEMREQLPDWVIQISDELSQVNGVAGVVLGGSRAQGRFKSDSDYDIGIYYHQESFDWEGIKSVARKFDDNHEPKGLAAPGEWGPWINGGGWLAVQKHPVDFILREYSQVSKVISDCQQGIFSSHYQIGHPNAFYSSIWMAELGLAVRLADPKGEVERLKSRTTEFPPLLQRALLEKFSFEAEFSLFLLKKMKDRNDPYYLNGLVFRFASCLIQVIFALNKQYFMNEKGSVELASGFSKVPSYFSERLNQICSGIPQVGEREKWLQEMQDLFVELLSWSKNGN